MSGNDADGGGSEDDEEEEDEDDDAEDLDTMATRLQVKGSATLRDLTPPLAAKARGKTPPVATVGKRKGPEGGGGAPEAAKRSKTASRTPSPAPAVASLGARVEAAVRGLVGSRPPRSVTMKDVTAMCKTTFAVRGVYNACDICMCCVEMTASSRIGLRNVGASVCAPFDICDHGGRVCCLPPLQHLSHLPGIRVARCDQATAQTRAQAGNRQGRQQMASPAVILVVFSS